MRQLAGNAPECVVGGGGGVGGSGDTGQDRVAIA